MGMRLRTSTSYAPEEMLVEEAMNPGLGSLNAIAYRANDFEPGVPLQIGANYGGNALRTPIGGWRRFPLLNAAAGVAPRDPYITVYTPTPAGSVQPSRTRVAPALMFAAQPDRLQSEPGRPVEYNPGGTATIGG